MVGNKEREKHTLVKMYISLKILVDKLNRGLPLKPPVSTDVGFCLTASGREIVVFDII